MATAAALVQTQGPPASTPNAPSRPEFEVASIKPAPALTPALLQSGKLVGIKVNLARVEIGVTQLKSLIAQAYQVKLFQVAGPDWMADEAFDIQATLPAGASLDQVPQMLKSLMEDRFGLKASTKMQEFSVYSMAVVKDGPRLTPVPADYDPAPTNMRRPFTMEQFVTWLDQALDRPVLDETHLDGQYIFDMTEIMKDVAKGIHARASGANLDTAGEPAGGGTLRALRDLGLHLEPCKRTLPVVAVEKLLKAPTEN